MVRLFVLHHLDKAVEQVGDVVRAPGWLPGGPERKKPARRCGRRPAVIHRTAKRAWPQIGGQGIGIDRETVVLAGDQDLSGLEILDRVVGAVMAKLHLHRLAPGSQCQQLMAEADTEGRHTVRQGFRGWPSMA
jgi:hypothetical protein